MRFISNFQQYFRIKIKYYIVKHHNLLNRNKLWCFIKIHKNITISKLLN